MYLFFMRRVLVFMRTVLPGVLMVMHVGIDCMGVLMGMFMEMLMRMGVLMLVRMSFLSVDMLMAVHVGMLMRVQMFVFVLSFHGGLPLLQKISKICSFPWNSQETLLRHLQHRSGPTPYRGFRVKPHDFRFILGAMAGTDQL
jgi:hypothetical protein